MILSLAIAMTLLFSSCYGEKDYYRILGIERDASQPEIKRAFRQLSLKVSHPYRLFMTPRLTRP